ncbi:MAG: energy transducer TonB [Candidatus Acidiferrales bacterium]|jgi:TonB family protein
MAISEMDESESAASPSGKTKGPSNPACVFCPNAQFSPEAIKHHTQGTVFLSIVVGIDGEAHDIRILRPLPNGLTENAIEAVLSWRFKPATGPDGAPVESKTTVEIVFHRY